MVWQTATGFSVAGFWAQILILSLDLSDLGQIFSLNKFSCIEGFFVFFLKESKKSHMEMTRHSSSEFSPSLTLVLPSLLIFSLFIEFIGVTLLNKTIQVSGTQFYNHHLYIVLCVHHPKSNLTPFNPLYPPPPPPTITTLLSTSMSFFFFFLFAQSLHPPQLILPTRCQPALYLWLYL